MTKTLFTDVNQMLDRGWTLSNQNSGLYTVFNTTMYSSGESETVVTTVKDPQIYKKKTKVIDEITGDIKIEGNNALKILDKYFGDYVECPIKKDENKQRALRRAKTLVRQKVIEGNLDHFLTLTYRENKQDLNECWKDWNRFLRLVRQKYPKFKYVVISEFQKRGAVHFHVATHGYMHANTLRAIWRNVIGQGNVDIKHRKYNQSFHMFACYITKYLTKQHDHIESYKNLYRCSQNIILKKIKFYLPRFFAFTRQNEIDIALNIFMKDIKQNYQHENGLFSMQWCSSLQPT